MFRIIYRKTLRIGKAFVAMLVIVLIIVTIAMHSVDVGEIESFQPASSKHIGL